MNNIVKADLEIRVKAIDEQIELEKRVLDTMAVYHDCELKNIVIHQCNGAIRGMNIAKEYLEDLIQASDQQLSLFDDQIDHRGGMI